MPRFLKPAFRFVFPNLPPARNIRAGKLLKIIREWPFFDLPSLEREIPRMENFARVWKQKHERFASCDVVFVGLGGAILGTQAIAEALLPFPKKNIHFLSNLDPTLTEKIFSSIRLKKTLFVVVSKSGETLETLTLFDLIVQKLYSKKLQPENHLLVITESKPSPLISRIQKFRLSFYPHREDIGGRFSVLTATSLIPSALLGLSIKKFFRGANHMREHFLSSPPSKNLPLKLVHTALSLIKRKKNILVLFPYSLRLVRFCDWYTQLIAESLGKNGKGITPLTAIGPKDQHSLLQLFLDGPKDKWFFFLHHVLKSSSTKNMTNIIEAERKGVEKSFTKRSIPFASLAIDRLDEETLGSLFFLFEIHIAVMGHFLNVNPFNQPAVEESKRITKTLLRAT